MSGRGAAAQLPLRIEPELTAKILKLLHHLKYPSATTVRAFHGEEDHLATASPRCARWRSTGSSTGLAVAIADPARRGRRTFVARMERLFLICTILAVFSLRLPLIDRFPFHQDEAIYGYWALYSRYVDPLFLAVWPDKAAVVPVAVVRIRPVWRVPQRRGSSTL